MSRRPSPRPPGADAGEAFRPVARSAVHAAPTTRFAVAATVVAAVLAGSALDAAGFPTPRIPFDPRGYVAIRTDEALDVDGRLDEASWRRAAWSADFVDIEGDLRPAPRYRTRVKMLWDDACLYVGATLEEPDVWATLTERDAVIYHDDDFEVFLDPDGDNHDYYELEINALGTVWDLRLVAPYRDGGPPLNAWDITGLRSAVFVDGTLNDPGDVDRGWSVELAIPWSDLQEWANRPVPPRDGDTWHMNFSRVEWRTEVRDGRTGKSIDPVTGKAFPEDNWVWSPQGLIAMHYPEMWGFVRFVTQDAAARAGASGTERGSATAETESIGGLAGTESVVGSEAICGWLLMQVYYAEKIWREDHSAYTDDPAALDLGDPDRYGADVFVLGGPDLPETENPVLPPDWQAQAGTRPAIFWPPRIEATTPGNEPPRFRATLTTSTGEQWTIDDTGRLLRPPRP